MCVTPKLGYFIELGQVSACMNGCEECSSEVTCSQCSTGFSQDLNSKCIFNCTGDPACKQCSSLGCLECNSGYLLEP